jgi:hypothetical protein
MQFKVGLVHIQVFFKENWTLKLKQGYFSLFIIIFVKICYNVYNDHLLTFFL